MTLAPPSRLGHVLHALGRTASTQAVLASLAAAGAPEGTAVTARHQTEGRGRRGHAWWDAPGQSLLCSVLLRPPGPLAHAPQLSLVAGLAVAEALDSVGVAARIKWPNDVVIDGRKVAGVLAEAAGGPGDTVRHVLLGIGINVAQTDFPEPLGAVATSLRLATGRVLDPAALLAPVLDRLSARYAAWLAAGLGGLREAWRSRATTLGQAVATGGGGQGVATDIDEDGALLVRLADGTVARLVAPPAALAG